jgi:Na+-translocating ferredoxin:NAD+ oxidoreductase RnfG subunit
LSATISDSLTRISYFVVLLLGLSAGVNRSAAEQFVSFAEAKILCYTNATRFEDVQFRLSLADRKAIESASGVKVRNSEARLAKAWSNSAVLGTIWLDHVVGKHELIDYVVAISPEGKVTQVEILEYREHYGGQIRQADWRAQFKGKTAEAPLRLGRDIYNISGATLSCRHVTEGVKRVLATFQHLRGQLLQPAADNGVPHSATRPQD